MRPTTPETDAQVLRTQAVSQLRRSYAGLTFLYDRPMEQIRRTTTYKTRKQLGNAFMGQIGEAQEFASDINLLTVMEVRALYEEYRSKRPDIF